MPVRARRGRIVDLAKAEWTEDECWVNGRNVEVGVVPLEVAHGEVGEALGDSVDIESSLLLGFTHTFR